MKYVSGVRSRCNYLIFPFVIYSKIAKVFSLRHIKNRKTDILQTDLMENFVAIKCCAASTHQCMRKSPAVDADPTTVRGSNGDANDLSKLSKLAWPVIWPSLQYIDRYDSTAVAQHNACCRGLPKIKLRCGVRCQYSVPNSITFMLDACAHFVIYVVYGCQVHIARKCNCHKLHGHRHTHTDTHSASSDAMPNCRNCASSTDPRRTMANQTSCLCMSVSYLCTMFNSAAG